MTNSEYSIRVCTAKDLDSIMCLQERICAAITQPDLFVSTCREENASYLILPNIILGVFDQERLIAYASLAFPDTQKDNLGWDLGWSEDLIHHCAKLDTIVVDSSYRGHGLQRALIRHCLSYASTLDDACIVLTTVSPANQYSLRNVRSEGFQILKRMNKYGGHDRYILGYSSHSLPVSTS